MNISSISGIGPLLDTKAPSLQEPESGGSSFAAMLNRSVNEVNDLLNTADRQSTNMALGKSENLHEAMIATEKAETALKFLTQVRNKALEAYHEVMRMQI